MFIVKVNGKRGAILSPVTLIAQKFAEILKRKDGDIMNLNKPGNFILPSLHKKAS